MKKLLLALFSSLLFFISPVSAHTLKIDGTIGAILHVDPNDEPVAGSPATLIFQVTDTSNKFNFAKCECQLTVFEGNKQLTSVALSSTDSGTASLAYMFPKKDVYEIEFVGIPQVANAFQAFTLSYEVRVATEVSSPTANQTFFGGHWFHVIVIGGGLLGLLVWIVYDSHKSRKASS